MLRGQELFVDMYIDGTPIKHFLSFHLSQSFNSHHYFELRMEHGKLGLPGLIDMKDTRDYVGRKLIISFGYDQINTNNFRGVITSVSLEQRNGFQGEIVVRGYSSTILIDRGPDLGSYLDNSLYSIVHSVTRGVPSGILYMAVNPSRTAPLDYVIQYRESDFDFLNRLSAEYYEWFYYDGEQLFFGKPDELAQAHLTYGQEIYSLNYGVNIAPVKQKRFFYEAKEDELLESEAEGKADGPPDLLHALDRSNEAYSKTFHQPVAPRIDSYGDLKSFVQYEEKANVSQLLKLTAESNSTDVRLGSEIQIDTSIRQDLSFVKDSLGKFLITRVEHYIDGVGRYRNSFEGVVASSERLPVKDYKKPSPDLQLANVVRNDDPKGQGRVKVKFKWQCDRNDETEWLRVLTPDAGSSKDVSTNRGFVFIPEVGDQVVVGFEEGNIARPVVIGSVFHGKIGAGGYANNHLKTIKTRSGCTIQIDDNENQGSITIEDPSGNTWHMDGAGNIEATAPKNFTINAGDNLHINVGKDMITQVGMNQSNTVGMNKMDTIGMNNTESVGAMKMTSVIGNANMLITGKLTEIIEGDIHSEVKQGKTVVNSESGIETVTTGKIMKNAQGIVDNRSGEVNLSR